ncbi:50S ribosomal protein L9 [candidate division KSB1 bacterium]|nr:50S ribosomal protein L9 [candidate division KSB1 bacterium]NIR69920.1 50S ribosomal protein L9 [candidate division KSB1 bacterium]NIS25829.1 50S ribosomal protein L9 [candidate division KSB1 bacterium]NIT72704.1 50S ribosomal protein L9 [candidate division KSB1 bacterium]NIU26518.1 50S ribosomal protein L9 [candidate division KSB1 bacterium]
MKVILKQDVSNVGQSGDIVEVKDGYARNFLIPRQVALQATPKNLKVYEQEKQRHQIKLTKEKRSAEQLAEKLDQVSLTAPVAVGEEDKVFGAVTSQNIADLLNNKGFDIDRKKIVLEEPLKALGVYEVPIKLHSEVEAKVKVWVVKE